MHHIFGFGLTVLILSVYTGFGFLNIRFHEMIEKQLCNKQYATLNKKAKIFLLFFYPLLYWRLKKSSHLYVFECGSMEDNPPIFIAMFIFWPIHWCMKSMVHIYMLTYHIMWKWVFRFVEWMWNICSTLLSRVSESFLSMLSADPVLPQCVKECPHPADTEDKRLVRISELVIAEQQKKDEAHMMASERERLEMELASEGDPYRKEDAVEKMKRSLV